jgi:DNA-binding transcriptional regulator YiaG
MTKDELKKIRESLGISQRDFARRIGVAPRTLARWEDAVHPIGLVYEKLIRLQAAAARLARPKGDA